ncbi:MAG TPA: PP2C family protein-serine/threonine phosphatase [Streptosporangiaceae bacterium]|nr:PP2C family protein-serine/threonine phosphatase [Streptosporangiaceae bacterium]
MSCPREGAAATPLPPPVRPVLEVAWRFRTARRSQLGGDWHDVVPLPGCRFAVIVGDVTGTAALMTRLRGLAQTLARRGLPPGELLERLSWESVTDDGAALATCLCALVDASAQRAVIGSAGHPQPVLALANGQAVVVSVALGPPLGLASSWPWATVTVGLPPGSTLALYTDGLLATRSRALDQGILDLCRALSATTALPVQAACDGVVSMLDAGREDDTTLVLARVPATVSPFAGGPAMTSACSR